MSLNPFGWFRRKPAQAEKPLAAKQGNVIVTLYGSPGVLLTVIVEKKQ